MSAVPDAIPRTVDQAGIAAVEPLIRPRVRRTPVLEVDRSEFGLGPGRLVLKLEQLQHSGSFKARGAFANLLLRPLPAAGVVAASGGNHGAAVAYAAQALGVPVKIFVPATSSPAKIARIRSYGTEPVITGQTYADALAAGQDWIAASGALGVHAFDQPETMLGAGSVGLEIAQQVTDIAAVLVGVGGGGLIAGIAAALAGSVPVIGAEPELAPTLTRALAAGEPVDAPTGSIALDSLAPQQIGSRTYPVIAAFVDRTVLVSDEEIRTAQRVLWDRLRIVAEPGGATAFAALLSGRYHLPQPTESSALVVVISGANTTAVDHDRA